MAAFAELATLEREMDAPEEWLCGAIGPALRRADRTGELPMPPVGSRPCSAFLGASRRAFREARSEASVATASQPLAPPACMPRPASAASTTTVKCRRAFYFSRDSIIEDGVETHESDQMLGEL